MRMRRRWGHLALLCLLLTLCQPYAAAQEEDEVDETHVAVLTDATFEQTIADNQFVLAEFYAPWCGHCKSLKPEYADAADRLAEAEVPVVLAKVDATENKLSAAKHGIAGYPTLKWFVGGKASDYTGGRKADDIAQWVLRKTGPPALLLKDASEFRRATQDKPAFLLGFFDKLEGEDWEAFTEFARNVEDVQVLETTSSEAAKAAGLTGRAPAFLFGTAHPGFDPTRVPAKGHPAFQDDGALGDQLHQFVLAEKLPPFLEFGGETQKAIFGSGISAQVMIIAEAKHFTRPSPATKAIEAAHAKYKGKLVFVTSTLGSKDSQAIVQYFAADASQKEPQVFGMSGQKRYTMPDALSADALKAFCQGILDGTLEPVLRSEDPPGPGQDKEGDVLVVVGKTFDSVVLDPAKDVFLEVYSPNCGHCKALTPTWKKLAKQLRKVDTVEVAKMDGTKNEHGAVQVEGFPHLVLFPAGPEAAPVPYSGDRSLKDLRQFLKRNAGIPFQLKKGGKQADADSTAEL